MTSNDRRGFKIDSICGYNIPSCVTFVGIATMIISLAALVGSIVAIKSRIHETSLNTKPLVAMDLIFSFTCVSVSSYQFIISMLMVWRKSAFICSLWFVSHMSILLLYLVLFTARAIVSMKVMQNGIAAITVLLCVIYEGVLLFFMVIVQSFMQSPKYAPEPTYY